MKEAQPGILSKPYFIVLFPLFFVFHGYVANYNAIPLKDASLLFFSYLIAGSFIVLISYFFYKNMVKSALMSLLSMFFFFFYGYLYDNIGIYLKNTFLTKYSVQLSIIGILLASAFIALKNTNRKLYRLITFLNIYFLLVILIDIGTLILKPYTGKKIKATTLSTQFAKCDTCYHPDIYLIVADEYAGPEELKDYFKFDNSRFYKTLSDRGFILLNSRSNYNYTLFSMASLLSMDYLKDIKGKVTDIKDYNYCTELIRNNNVIRFLNAQGYNGYNYSIFDVQNQPALFGETMFTTKTKFITAQTIWDRLENNIITNMGGIFKNITQKKAYEYLKANEKIYAATLNEITKKGSPKFVYTHLEMPHYPYYFDSLGRQSPYDKIKEGSERDTARYISYLKYANTKLVSLIDAIQKASKQSPLIILMSDHGFREFPNDDHTDYQFINLLSIHIPWKDATAFGDSTTNVNLFRKIFNIQFNQHLPLLKDSSIIVSFR